MQICRCCQLIIEKCWNIYLTYRIDIYSDLPMIRLKATLLSASSVLQDLLSACESAYNNITYRYDFLTYFLAVNIGHVSMNILPLLSHGDTHL
jgi:hypothetical protein